MIAIINYGSGNIRAIGNIYDKLKIKYKVANTPHELQGSSHIILPGVGAFDTTMNMLRSSGFIETLEVLVFQKRIPILGICVGMQILSDGSDEGSLKGLSWIQGRVKKFKKESISHLPKIPHLGWNSIELERSNKLFDSIDVEEGFYFIHSYFFDANNNEHVLARTEYGGFFASSVNYENIYGVQFHPEKSHSNGIKLLKNFSEL